MFSIRRCKLNSADLLCSLCDIHCKISFQVKTEAQALLNTIKNKRNLSSILSHPEPTDMAVLTRQTTSGNTTEYIEMSLDSSEIVDLKVTEASDMVLDEGSGSEQND